MARRWTEEEVLGRLRSERGHDAFRTLESFRQQLTQSLDRRARIEWRGSDLRQDEYATLWPRVVHKDKGIYYYPPVCFRVDGEVEVPLRYMKRLASGWNKKSFLQENRERTPFNDEERRRKLIDHMNEIPGVYLPDSVNGRPTFRLHLLRNEDVIDRLVEVFNWYIGQIVTWESAYSSQPEDSIDRLRQRALKAALQGVERGPRESKRRYQERRSAVREYVLARADGACESCGEPAPFLRPDGTPYLESHHTIRMSEIRISDEDPDHPDGSGRSALIAIARSIAGWRERRRTFTSNNGSPFLRMAERFDGWQLSEWLTGLVSRFDNIRYSPTGESSNVDERRGGQCARGGQTMGGSRREHLAGDREGQTQP